MLTMPNIVGRTVRSILLDLNVSEQEKKTLRDKFNFYREALINELNNRDLIFSQKELKFLLGNFFSDSGAPDGLSVWRFHFKTISGETILKSDNVLVEDITENLVLIDPF